jgi:ferredoxin--NADP+ reductase
MGSLRVPPSFFDTTATTMKNPVRRQRLWLFFVALLAATQPRQTSITAFAFTPSGRRVPSPPSVLLGRASWRTSNPKRHATLVDSTTSTSSVSSSAAAARIKRVGGGVALHPAGEVDATTMRFSLFDPDQEGKLQGTFSLDERLKSGINYHYYSSGDVVATGGEAAPITELEDAQDWLEHLDRGDGEVPAAFAKATAPVVATVIGRGRVIGPDAPGDIEHVVLQLPDGMHYVEGQSLSVIPPTTNANDKPHKPRLYSIASTRYGDLLDGHTVSLCVRRAVYVDPATGQEDETKKGICSNFLCDCQVGDKVYVAGPVGKTMLLPKQAGTDIIMVATGTGIAPFRAFLHRLFVENTVAAHLYTGTAWLILGVPTTSSLLYEQEIAAMQSNKVNGHLLQVDYAISREMTNAAGGKLYVQDILADRIGDVLQRLDNGAVIYFCGLKGMMPGILTALEAACTQRGLDWKSRLDGWKKNGQWHVEVY